VAMVVAPDGNSSPMAIPTEGSRRPGDQ
jgi:hypothetical protein